MTNISETLADREKSHGSFFDRSIISQNIVRAMQDSPNWQKLDDDMKEALHLIAHKASRILNGDAWFHDHWHDIVGYAELVASRLLKEPKGEPVIGRVFFTPEEVIDDE